MTSVRVRSGRAVGDRGRPIPTEIYPRLTKTQIIYAKCVVNCAPCVTDVSLLKRVFGETKPRVCLSRRTNTRRLATIRVRGVSRTLYNTTAATRRCAMSIQRFDTFDVLIDHQVIPRTRAPIESDSWRWHRASFFGQSRLLHELVAFRFIVVPMAPL